MEPGGLGFRMIPNSNDSYDSCVTVIITILVVIKTKENSKSNARPFVLALV